MVCPDSGRVRPGRVACMGSQVVVPARRAPAPLRCHASHHCHCTRAFHLDLAPLFARSCLAHRLALFSVHLFCDRPLIRLVLGHLVQSLLVGVAHLSKCSMAHVCENKCFAGVPRPVASQARVSRVRGRVSAVCRWAQGRKCHRHVWQQPRHKHICVAKRRRATRMMHGGLREQAPQQTGSRSSGSAAQASARCISAAQQCSSMQAQAAHSCACCLCLLSVQGSVL